MLDAVFEEVSSFFNEFFDDQDNSKFPFFFFFYFGRKIGEEGFDRVSLTFFIFLPMIRSILTKGERRIR